MLNFRVMDAEELIKEITEDQERVKAEAPKLLAKLKKKLDKEDDKIYAEKMIKLNELNKNG